VFSAFKKGPITFKRGTRYCLRGLISQKTNATGVAVVIATTDSNGLNPSHPQRGKKKRGAGESGQ
jgi:hypothetical protein